MIRLWGWQTVFLGLWEGIALITGKIPTITHVVKASLKRWPVRSKFVLSLWAIGLAKHFFDE